MLKAQLILGLTLSFFLCLTDATAAGSTVEEDFTLNKSLCKDMLDAATNKDSPRFIELADAALKLSEAQRRDNSMAIDRFRPKIRAAKKAAKTGDFDSAAKHAEEAMNLMQPASATWDGGS